MSDEKTQLEEAEVLEEMKEEILEGTEESSREISEEIPEQEEKEQPAGEKEKAVTKKKTIADLEMVDLNDESNPFKKMAADSRQFASLNGEEKKGGLFAPFYFLIVMVYMELVFHIYNFHKIDLNTIGIILFSASFALLTGFLCSVFPAKVNRILATFFTLLFSIYFCVQIVYHAVFQNYLSLSAMLGVAGQALDYQDTIMKNVLNNLVALILLLLPIVFICTPFARLIDFKRKSKVPMILAGVAPFAAYFLAVLLIRLTNSGMYSAYNVYKENTSIDMAIEKLGVTEATMLDFGLILGVEYGSDDFAYTDALATLPEEPSTEDVPDVPVAGVTITEPEEVVEVVPKKEYNELDIDFDKLLSETEDEGLISLHTYFQNAAPTKTNEYTGMFEGYNVIFVTAEGLSGYAITEENYPTLYKMANTGFVFNNYYTPLWYGSTVGGEYANLTGLMPANGQYLSLKETGKRKNSMRLTLATQLSSLGYATIGYHNNTYTYYGRDMSHPNLGYTWIGVGNGWLPETTRSGNALWPQSDLYMVETTFDDYCDAEPFNIYYLSVSGHVLYNFAGNQMAIRNKEVFEESGYSETTRAYLSCQYELEKAMTRLVELLEEKGIADHTLIVLAPDHVPYNDKAVLDELAGYELENNFEWYENTLIMWSAGMEEPVQVDKVCSSLDILPTVSNLMGLDYDSRLIIGKDILSDTEGLVMFNNRSWITDYCMYNATNGEITNLTDEEVTDEYIEGVKATVRTRFKIAENILEYNYYQYIEDLYPEYTPVIPQTVIDRMAAAGFHTDGTAMTQTEINDWNAAHPKPTPTPEPTPTPTPEPTQAPATTPTPES